ncbi:BppU family phage baseplate upper protein [Staphylococcus chromogenes]|uniref:BppU family phage baseplate upper protein n=1 Tax=Staphylococcus chromogenes TaxID=46126 RepID=UPI003D7C10A6
MEIEKIALIHNIEEPYLKPISDTGIGFYNSDVNTAKFKFQVTNHDGPLLVSKENTTAYAIFKSRNGSISNVLELEYLDPLNGIVGITVPNDFLIAATDSYVDGQIYLTKNGVSDTVTFAEFTFFVKDALINKIDGRTKVSYIKTFDELRKRLEAQMTDFKQQLSEAKATADEVQTTSQNAIDDITNKLSSATKDLNLTVDNAKQSLQQTSEDTEFKLKQALDQYLIDANAAKQQVLQSVKDNTYASVSDLDLVKQDYQTKVEAQKALSDAKSYVDDKQWQKAKMTLDDGSLERITGFNFNQPDTLLDKNTGFYYIHQGVNYAQNGISTGYGYLQLLKSSGNTYVEVIFRPYISTDLNNNEMYIIRRSGASWGKWSAIATKFTDTGWIPYSLINGANSNVAYTESNNFNCSYRIIQIGTKVEKRVRFNGSNIINGQVIAQLPVNFAKNTQTFPIRVPISTVGTCYIVIRPNGTVNFYVSGETKDWTSNSYLYGEVSWTD